MTNQVILRCITSGEFKVNHQFQGKDNKVITALETNVLYTSEHKVVNIIKVIVIKDSYFEQLLKVKGIKVSIEGELHNFNKNAFGKRISEVFVKPFSIKHTSLAVIEKNQVIIEGELCGDVSFKTRHSGLYVAEFKLKVKRLTGGFDYIQLVAFADMARKLNLTESKSKIKIKGRIHSRSHMVQYKEEGTQKEVERIALEVCVHELEKEEHSIAKEIESHSLALTPEQYLQIQRIKATKFFLEQIVTPEKIEASGSSTSIRQVK